jgi:ammonia channel protein AmtB
MAQELEQSCLPSAGLCQSFPLSTMIYFQFVFAAITIVIMAGAFLGRMNFYAWMIFVPLWITFSYTIGAYSLWGGGFLFQRGVIDYSGGYVIHLSSGTLVLWELIGLVPAWQLTAKIPTKQHPLCPDRGWNSLDWLERFQWW